MDNTPRQGCPKCKSENVYCGATNLKEEGEKTWNCVTCWHKWPASESDAQLNPST
jgi:hypothetical protein